MLTCREVLGRYRSRLERSGVDSPRLSAEILLAESLGISRMELFLDLDRVLKDAELRCGEELVRRRSRGEPVAYLLERKEFYGREFRVDGRVLIPRPETELIVDLVCAAYPEGHGFLFLDIGVGSGALAGTLACERTSSRGVATDMSPGALSLAAENIARLGVDRRVLLSRMDLASALGPGRFDLVVSNPPYLSDADMDMLSREVALYEPREALHAGPSGIEVALEVISQAAGLLRPNGRLYMEIGATQGSDLRAGISTDDRIWREIEVHRDLAGLDRVVTAVRCG